MKYLFFSALIFIFQSVFSQAYLDKTLTTSVIQLEKESPDGTSLIFHGTAFGLYNYTLHDYYTLVTCAHVLKNKYIYVRFPLSDSSIAKINRMGGGGGKWLNFQGTKWLYDGYSFRTRIELIKDSTFSINDSLDIGIIKCPILGGEINGNDTLLYTNFKSVSKSMIKNKSAVELGTNIYFLGFPFMIGSNFGYEGTGFFSDERINPLVRAGIVAWKADKNSQFLIDGFSYGGNSGSPIFTQIDLFGNPQYYLIGMVLGHLSEDVSNKPEISKYDVNRGLARCIWIDDIQKLEKKFIK